MNSGIYKIENLINGKIYIGSSVDLLGRKNAHFSQLNRNIHGNKKLQNSFNKYGKDNFNFKILVKCPPEYRLKLEQWFIDNLKPWFNLYKKAIGGTNGKLLDVEILDIFQMYYNDITSKTHIRKKYNLTVSNLSLILTRKRYSHVKIPKELEKFILLRKNTKPAKKFYKHLGLQEIGEIKWLVMNNFAKWSIAKKYNISSKNINGLIITKCYEHVVIKPPNNFDDLCPKELYSKPCYCINTLDGSIIEFNTLTEASKNTKISKGKLNNLLKSENAYKGFYFKYQNI